MYTFCKLCVCVCMPSVILVVPDSLWPHGPWDFSWQEYWSGFPFPPPGFFPNPGIEPISLALQVDSTTEPPEYGGFFLFFPCQAWVSLLIEEFNKLRWEWLQMCLDLILSSLLCVYWLYFLLSLLFSLLCLPCSFLMLSYMNGLNYFYLSHFLLFLKFWLNFSLCI